MIPGMQTVPSFRHYVHRQPQDCGRGGATVDEVAYEERAGLDGARSSPCRRPVPEPQQRHEPVVAADVADDVEGAVVGAAIVPQRPVFDGGSRRLD